MHRASPPRKIPDAILEVAAAGSVDDAEFINLEASHITHADGFARGVYAIMPEKAEYDRIRFIFGVPDTTNVDAATIQVWSKSSDDTPFLVGTSELSADGTFPPIETPNFQGSYAFVVGGLTEGGGTGTNLSVDVFVQGVFETLAVM